MLIVDVDALVESGIEAEEVIMRGAMMLPMVIVNAFVNRRSSAREPPTQNAPSPGFAGRWAKGEYIRIPTSRKEITATALGTWRLEPN